MQNGSERIYAFVKDGKIMPRQIRACSTNSRPLVSSYQHTKASWHTGFMGEKASKIDEFFSLHNKDGLTLGRDIVQNSAAGRSYVSHSVSVNPNYKVTMSRFDKNIQQKPVTSSWNDVPSPVTLLEDQTIINRFDKGLSTQSSILTQNSVLKPIDVEQMPTFKSFGDTLKSEYLFYRN